MFQGVRYRPSLRRPSTEANLRRARDHLAAIKERIAAGTFQFAEEFPRYRHVNGVMSAPSQRTCGQRVAFEFGFRDHPRFHNPASMLKCMRKRDRVIDPFRIDDAERFIAAIHQNWGEAQGNYYAFRFFTGLGPSEEIALLVSD